MIRRLPALAVIFGLGACAFVAEKGNLNTYPKTDLYTFAQLEMLFLINTHKTISDHIVGFLTGKDCSSPRAERGDAYCMEWPDKPAPPPQVYCYSTLARPTCYSQPYNEGNDRLIGFVPAATPIR